MNIMLNTEKNGIEIRFEKKPDSEILENLKNNGFRWSRTQKMWYAKQTAGRIAFCDTLGEINRTVKSAMNVAENAVFDLWENTRTENIGNNFEKYKIYDNKELASIFRKHLKLRFPFCKWSVRMSGYNSISIEIKESPFKFGSDELNAIVHYAYMFAQSYNYDNSDSYSDYFDVNFYGVYESKICEEHRYKQCECVDMEKIMELFQSRKTEFEKEEEKRLVAEMEDVRKQEEIKMVKFEESEKIRKENVAEIEEGAIVKNKEYFVTGARFYGNKINSVDDVETDTDRREKCKVTKEVYLAEDLYNKFITMFLSDFSFLENMGGSATEDLRINSIDDYNRMTEEERNTVEWYLNNCVSIYCDNVLKLVIDPQGYSYARYIYEVDEKSEVTENAELSSGISEEQYAENLSEAQKIVAASKKVITENEISVEWWINDTVKFSECMKNSLYDGEFKLTKDTIRALDSGKLKSTMYRLYDEIKTPAESFSHSGIVPGQKVTIFKAGMCGGETVQCTVIDIEYGEYAQYKNAVKLTIMHRNKRKLYYKWIYDEVLVFDGWHNLPDSLFFEVCESHTSGVICHRSILRSFDRKYYDIVRDYMQRQGAKMLVDCV